MRRAWNSKGGSFRKQLVYFSSPNLMVRVSFKRGPNAIQYSSHREMVINERSGIERYLLDNVPIKAKHTKNTAPAVQYMGVEEDLVTKLDQLPSRHKRLSVVEKESRVEDAVRELINQSLANYYFEQIGNALVEIRRLSGSLDMSLLSGGFEEKLRELVEAYNLHTEKKVSVHEIVPEELREYVK